ncbi:hypothetical protein [Nocardioides sp. T2.26MG-1]|nr:hypothetical protein [Nocardioides sp. T2.26MG-1]CAI9417455.1 hypothetical protein HIDPHFAB_03024 [Nocardioides sp. T2.26MG-1]
MDDVSVPGTRSGTLAPMDLEHWTDLDLAYLLAFGTHPDLQGQT